MDAQTAQLWAIQNRHEGDRRRLFSTVANVVDADRVLYPGSFLDVTASMVFDDVTYVDMDKRLPTFFGDEAGVRSIIDAERDGDSPYTFAAVHADFTRGLDLEEASFDLLVSLYAGFVSEQCTKYLRIGGSLLVNPSHGDAALASIDDRYELTGAIKAHGGAYAFANANLDGYFVPKRSEPVTRKRIHDLGKGIAYTTSAFAYLFTRIR